MLKFGLFLLKRIECKYYIYIWVCCCVKITRKGSEKKVIEVVTNVVGLMIEITVDEAFKHFNIRMKGGTTKTPIQCL